MAARKRRTSSARRVNSKPRRRPRTTAVARTNRGRRGGLFAVNRRNRRNRTNPARRRRVRRNPALKGVFEGMVIAGIGMAITDVVQGLVPGGMLPGGAVAKIGIRLGLAWGIGAAAEKFGFAKYANLLAIGGAVGAFQDTFRLLFGGLLAPAPAAPQQLAPGQVLLPAGATGDGFEDITYFPGFGDITYGPQGAGLYS